MTSDLEYIISQLNRLNFRICCIDKSVKNPATPAIPDLQAVTEEGYIITNSIEIDGNSFLVRGGSITSEDGILDVTNVSTTAFVHIEAGLLQIAATGSNISNIKADNVTGSKTVQLPNADGTLALTTAASGTFTTVDSKTITVVNGIITSIV